MFLDMRPKFVHVRVLSEFCIVSCQPGSAKYQKLQGARLLRLLHYVGVHYHSVLVQSLSRTCVQTRHHVPATAAARCSRHRYMDMPLVIAPGTCSA